MGPTVVSGWRRFHMRRLGFRVAGTGVTWSQVNAARICCHARVICSAHRQVWSIRSLVCRALLLIRAATCRTRYRNVAISHVARSGSSAKPSSLDQATRSHRGHHDLQPRTVGCIVVAGEIPHPGRLGLPDPVFHPGVLAVPQVQTGELAGHDPGRGVGDEGGDPMPVDVQEC